MVRHVHRHRCICESQSSVLITFEKQFEILLFLEISWFASFSMLEGGCNVPQLTRSTPRGVQIMRGGRGAGLQLGDDTVEDV